MNTLLLFAVFTISVISTNAYACTFQGSFLDGNKPTANCPERIKKLAARADICIHWGGEEPYNKKRAEEIGKGWKKERCDSFPCDAEKLFKRFPEATVEHEVIEHIISEWQSVYGQEDQPCHKQ